jgi:hypothetical protein
MSRAPRKRLRPKLVIGWSEHVDLPDWGIFGIRAKVDTGAASSAIHVDNLKELGHGRIHFDVIVKQGRRRRTTRVRARVHRRSRVRSSSGHAADRLFVTTTLRAGPVERHIELSLVDRDLMRYRMLLGRSALAGDFWVDAGRTSLLGRSR